MRPARLHSRSAIPLLAGFLVLLCSAAAAIVLASEQRTAGGWIRHTFEVQSDLHTVLNLGADLETGQRGYLLTGRQPYLAPYNAARAELPNALAKLKADTQDNPQQTPLRTQLERLFVLKLSELQQTVDLRRAGHADQALALVNGDSGWRAMGEIRQTVAAMQKEEIALLARRAKDYRTFNGLSQLVLFATPLLILALGILTVLDGRRRFHQLEAVNRRLAEEADQRERVELQVRQLQKMEAVGQLTGGIAHDFNNMLAIILGSLDIARRRLGKGETDKALSYIDSAAEGARRAATLTSRLLAFSRQQPLEPRVLEPNRLVAGMSELLHRTIGEAVVVETVLGAGLWKVKADPSQLENAVVNLAVNARDAMPEGGKLTLETANCELDDQYASAHADLAPGQYVMLSVTDNGVGMAPEVVQRAFEPFYTTKDVGKGTGLGLSQVFGFVKQSGGHVAIYSEPGAGTTVKVYLPRHFGAVDDQGAAIQDVEPELARGSPDEIVLVVEDEEQVRRMTVEQLRELGYTVVHASAGEEALRRLGEHPGVKLLFTDVVMPGMNGRQLADRARALNSSLKVLYATGYTRNAIVHNGVLDPGAALISKPFATPQLAAKVRQTLDA